ncbi:alpha-2-macroglobulin [Parvularcula sp. IMCC14364]|uniref:alpha-2-macroglobulin family protein n=1 Tax=Parvularcula sp. IMCC14364 TaxID=3067902 RepID=UPI0027417538|nr:alpha-2-macroglobulin [Parvularcula sp. IMCC14364]
MFGKSLVTSVIAIAVAFAAGLFIGRVGFRDIEANTFQPPVGDVEELTAQQRANIPLREYETVREADAARGAPPLPDEFAFARLTLDTTDETPKACFTFTQALADDVNYADFVELAPSAQVVASVAGETVCLAGLDFNRDYDVTLRAGLPDAAGEEIGRSETVTVSFGDKPAYVGFSGNGVILPRLEADGLGLETVNVDRLKVSIHRVGERALAYKSIMEGDTIAEDRYGYPWDQEDGQDVGVKLWEGQLEVADLPNQEVTTVFPLGAALGEARRQADGALQPGAYFVSVEDDSTGRTDSRRPARAWRWILFTDMALTTYRGADGIDVVLRSLKSAAPVGAANVRLIAQNNDVLAELETDGNGYVHFPGPVTRGTGPLSPKMIVAYGPENDFSVLDLSRSPLDLTDRDIGGRYAGGPVDAYLYFDRGIYRPGEVAHISGLLRDHAGDAVADRPVTLELRRPNYTIAEEIRIDSLEIGGFSQSFNVPSASPRGMWTAILKVDGSEETHAATFSVEDFVPQRIAVELGLEDDTPVLEGERRAIDVDVRFLYGAPGSGLNVEGEARLRVDPNPFPDYEGFSFGDTRDTFSDQRLNLGETMTDGDGQAALTLAVDPGIASGGKPLRAELVVGVAEPGGRFVRESTRLPVRVDERYIGIRRSGNSRPGRNEPVEFDLVLLGQDGAPVDQEGLEWRIIEEDYRFEWYRQNGEWRWRRDYRDILISTETIDVRAGRLANISRQLDYGSYRLEVRDPVSDAYSSVRFYAGWNTYASGAQTPDQASLTIPDDPVRPGARTRVTLAAPYAGEAVIAIATDRVHQVMRMEVSERPQEIMIETDPNWGTGFYVMATIITPRDVVDQPVPRRAMGVGYVPFDMAGSKLELAFETEEMIRPRQSLDLPVRIDGADIDETIMMTVAAVDEGILRLTKFDSPDPAGWYFGKKALGVQVYDDYGRLLDANLGAATRFGGDQLGGEGLTVVPTKTVALFRGPVSVNGDGVAQVPIEVPDFNGELRLMAVAWSEDKIGSADRALTVRDPVPAELALPRFLGPNDAASTTLLIDNVEGRSGVYMVNIDGDGPVSIAEAENFNLATGQRQDAIFPLQAGEIGIGAVDLSVSGPDDFAVARSYPIQVRAPYFPVTQVETEVQQPGAAYLADESLLDGYLAGDIDVTVSYSPLRGIDPQSLLGQLRRYPYGCTEQLTSSAFPLLYADRLGAMTGDGPDRALRPRVQEAINKILARQSPDGAFGLWRAGDGYSTGWIGVYVTDFLYRAQQEGYFVPDTALESAYSALQQLTKTDRWMSVSYITRIERGTIYADNQEFLRRRSAAYAFYVLARAGRADLSDLRYFHDSFITEVPNPLARAHAGTALALLGDRARAANAFKLAEEVIGYNNAENYYQSPLRDAAAMIPLAAEIDNQPLVSRLTETLDEYLGSEYYNTQEQAFLLLAAASLLDQSGDVTIAVDGAEIADGGKTPRVALSRAMLQDGVRITNESDGPLFRSVAVHGTPAAAPAAQASGFTLTKQIRTLDGQPVDLAAISQNDRLVISVSGRPQDFRLHPAIVVDMLPPGFEIESVISETDGARNGIYGWLDGVSRAKVAEARDDRFVAAIDLRRYEGSASSGRFKLAYIVRAVTPGTYVLPGSVIEDMYRPGVFGRTSVQQVNIAAAD